MASAAEDRMKACNSEAGDKKGDERKAFMSNCLKGGAPAAMPMNQQEKRKKCNTDASAKSLNGDDRKGVHERVPQGRQEDVS